jgi:hypothetical protein
MRLNGYRCALLHYQTSIYDQTPGCMQPNRQTHVPPWGKCTSDVLLCSAAKEWGDVLTICDCVCLSGFQTTSVCDKALQLAPLTQPLITSLSSVCRHVWYQHVSGMIRCGHADIDFAYPGARNNSIMSVQFLPHILSLKYSLIILYTVERSDEWHRITHSKRSVKKTSWPEPRLNRGKR